MSVISLSQDESLQNNVQKNYVQWKNYINIILVVCFGWVFFAYFGANSPSSKFQVLG